MRMPITHIKDLKNRRYLDFPVVLKQIRFSNYPGIDFEWTQPFSISFWLHNKGSAITRYVYWKYETNASSKGFAIFIDSSRRLSYRFVDGAGGTGQGFFGGATASNAEANHFLYCYKGKTPNSGTSHCCYVNGTRIGASQSVSSFDTGFTISNTSPIIFGGIATNFFAGFARDLIVFNEDMDSDINAAYLFGATESNRTWKGLQQPSILTAATLYCRLGDDYSVSGSTILFPNRLRKDEPGYSTSHTVSNIIITGNSLSMFSEYDTALEKVEWKNKITYTAQTLTWSDNIGKTTNDGAYNGSAQSTKKIVGDGRVHWFIHSTAGLRHTYMGISDMGTTFANPATAGNKLAFGAGNSGFLVYSGATLMHNGVTPAYRDLMTVESSGNSTIFFFKLNGVTQYTLTGCSFPNGWYVTPINLYVQSLYRVTWDSWFDFTGINGTLNYNDLI